MGLANWTEELIKRRKAAKRNRHRTTCHSDQNNALLACFSEGGNPFGHVL